MSEIRTIPPQLTKDQWNALLDHALEKPASYIIRNSNGTIQAINGSTGKIDYSGTDAASVINSALSALTSGGKLFIKKATYPITSTLAAPTNPEKLIIESDGALLQSQADIYVLSIYSNTTVHGLRIDGNGHRYCGIKIGGGGNGAYNTIVEKCEVYGFASSVYEIAAIYLYDATGTIQNIIIKDCYIHDNINKTGVLALATTVGDYRVINVQVLNNRFYNNGAAGVNLNVGSTECLVMGNYIEKHACGVHIENSPKTRVLYNIIKDTTLTPPYNLGNPNHAIIVDRNSDDVEIVGNIISDTPSDKYGIYLISGGTPTYGAKRPIITGNKIYNCGRGIYTEYSEKGLFSDNEIYLCHNHGMSFWVDNYATILGNRVYDNNVDNNVSPQGSGIYLSDVQNSIIASNEVFDDRSTPLQTNGIIERFGTANNLIADNRVFGNTVAQIVVVNAIVKNNIGFTTENSGTATIPSGQTSVTVNHGLAGTPSKVVVTPRGNIGSVWVSARDATNITITCSSAPTANTVVDWSAEM